MLRRVLICLFILANLGNQASVAYACLMMGGAAPVVMKDCCCDPDPTQPASPAAAMDPDCCETIVDVPDGPGNQVGHLHAGSKLPDYHPQLLPPALLAVPLTLAAQPPGATVVWDRPSAHRADGADLYWRTQRFRL